MKKEIVVEVFPRPNEVNANGNIYTEEAYNKFVNDVMQKINEGTCLVTSDTSFPINPETIVGKIENFSMGIMNNHPEVTISLNDMGEKYLETLAENKIAVGSRGTGRIVEKDDYEYITDYNFIAFSLSHKSTFSNEE